MSTNTAAYSNEDLTAFRRDIVRLFNRESGGHTSRWTYTGRPRAAHQPSGSELWRAFLEASRNYYIPKHEMNLIAANKLALAEKFAAADTFVDFGSGSKLAVQHKALPIAHLCENVKIYVPIDLSQDLLNEAKEVAEASEIKLEVVPIHGDFYYRERNEGKKRRNGDRQEISLPGTNRAGIMFGATISNMNMTEEDDFPAANIMEKIQDLAALLKKGTKGSGYMAFSYDSNPDLQGTALKAYDNINWKRMIVGLMTDVQALLEPNGFNAFAWQHVAVPNKRKHVIHQCVEATESQAFKIGDEAFSIRRGDRFVVVNNIKYPPDLMQELIKGAGFTPDEPLRKPNNHMVIQTFPIP